MVKRYALAMGRRRRPAQQEWTRVETQRPRCPAHGEHAGRVEARRAAVTQWTEGQRLYRHHRETLSLALPPFRGADAAPQTSEQVAARLHAAVEAIEALAARHQFPACPTAKIKVRKP